MRSGGERSEESCAGEVMGLLVKLFGSEDLRFGLRLSIRGAAPWGGSARALACGVSAVCGFYCMRWFPFLLAL